MQNSCDTANITQYYYNRQSDRAGPYLYIVPVGVQIQFVHVLYKTYDAIEQHIIQWIVLYLSINKWMK